MVDEKIDISDRTVARLAFAQSGQYRVRDNNLRGFFVLVGKRSKTFVAQGEYWKSGVRQFSSRTKVGNFGKVTSREAKAKAREILSDISNGIRPGQVHETLQGSITLRQAWDRYRVAHMERKGLNKRTIENYRDHMERLFSDWLDRPIATLGENPLIVVQRHDLITQQNGPYIANGSMRSLRAIYNHVLKTNRDIPQVNPAIAIDWNREKRRNSGIGTGELMDWLLELSNLGNALRREFHLLTLLSGSRPTALKSTKIEHIDLNKRLLHVPNPKGGEDKAFDIPLSRPMIKSLLRTMRLGKVFFPDESSIWLFPADSRTGHIEEHKEKRGNLSRWGNDLRQTYRNLAQVAGIGESDVHLLMNHALPGVNGGYLTRDRLTRNHLRAQQERISKLVMSGINTSQQESLSLWLHGTK